MHQTPSLMEVYMGKSNMLFVLRDGHLAEFWLRCFGAVLERASLMATFGHKGQEASLR